MVDFFADLNGNKVYDPPSADHAWRMDLDDVHGDTSLTFAHNTNFTDIAWDYILTMQFMDMGPHLGQMFDLKVFRINTEAEDSLIGDVTLDAIENPNFTLTVNGLMVGSDYRIDFYADYNNNKTYDAPPVDHAWRIVVNNVKGDTIITFTHNTDFTDIGEGDTRVLPAKISGVLVVYPNPSTGPLNIVTNDGATIQHIRLYTLTGQILDERSPGTNRVSLDYSYLKKGIYLLKVDTMDHSEMLKLIFR